MSGGSLARLEADSIGKAYGRTQVLRVASLRARAGLVTGLLGRNGAGKTTLLEIAAGCRSFDTGIVKFEGEAYLRPRLAVLASRGLFYLPSRDILSPGMPLYRQLNAVARRFGTQARLDSAIEILNAAPLLNTAPSRFSGGELRRAEFALAMVRAPSCLLADEPLRGVAPVDAEILSVVLRQLATEGCAVVISGHEVETILGACDRVTWCGNGTTYEYESADVARADERFQAGYLSGA